jgi:pSer/pThr/pTyr-binding forkhead associated (FHA) protein
MIRITIGRNSENRIVLTDPSRAVSSAHAEILIQNNGGLTIRDLSTNGTFVNGHRIPKFLEVPLKRGDQVTFAAIVPLDWSRIPLVRPVEEAVHTIQVGKGEESQYKLASSQVSREHATIAVNRKGAVFIMDHSTNGTFINGQKIAAFQFMPVKRGSKVTFGNSESLQWEKVPGKRTNPLIFVVLSLVLIAGLAFWQFRDSFFPGGESIDYYKKSVVLVYNKIYFTKTNPRHPGQVTYVGRNGETTSADELSRLMPFEIYGSGFFVGKDGQFVTNKHVLRPWEVKEYKDALANTLSLTELLNKTSIGGISSELGIIPNGTSVSPDDIKSSLLACAPNSIRVHPDPNVDLGIAQLNIKSLPAGSTFVDPERHLSTKKEAINDLDQVVVLGYPLGLGIGLNSQDKLVNSNEVGNVSMMVDRYQIQYTAPSTYGASGSPVILSKSGKVCAVNFAGYSNAPGHNRGIRANFILDLLTN